MRKGYNLHLMSTPIYCFVYSIFNSSSETQEEDYPPIAVIAVAPTGKVSFVYSYVQPRLKGQYNGKWPFSLVYVLTPLITPIRAIKTSKLRHRKSHTQSNIKYRRPVLVWERVTEGITTASINFVDCLDNWWGAKKIKADHKMYSHFQHLIVSLYGSHLSESRMASVQVVETSVTNNSPSQDFHHPDDRFQSRYVTPGFKPFSYEK